MYSAENNSLKSTLNRIDYYLLDIKAKIQPNQKEGDKIEDTLFNLPPIITYDLIEPIATKLKRLKYESFHIQIQEALKLAERIENTIYYILIELPRIIIPWPSSTQEEIIYRIKLLADQVEELVLD